MPDLRVVYYSGSGHTRRMAEAVLAGAASVPGVDARLVPVEGKDIVEGRYRNRAVLEDLDGADAIIFGSPTYVGSIAAPLKALLEATSGRFGTRAWAGKVAAGFTVSGGPSGDKLNTLISLVVFAMQHGMVWVGLEQTPYNEQGINRLSFYLGAAGQAAMEPPEEKPGPEDLETGRLLGVRVAEITRKLRG